MENVTSKSSKVAHAVGAKEVFKQRDITFITLCNLSLLSDGGYYTTDQEVTCKNCLRKLTKLKLKNGDPPVFVAIDDDGTVFTGNTLEELRTQLIDTYGEEDAASALELKESSPIKFFKAHRIEVEVDVQTAKYLKSIQEYL